MSGVISLTFDDALPCQLENAIPVMDRFGVPGTFFAITNSPEYPLDVHGWRKVSNRGLHEIGSHSVTHRKAASLSAPDADYEARESKRVLENHFDEPVVSFCYPYTDAPAHLSGAVRGAGYKQARGGRVASPNKFRRPGDGLNLFDVPCFHVNGNVIENGEAARWVLETMNKGAWLTLMFHAIGDHTGWDNVPTPVFDDFIGFLSRQNSLDIATFADAAEMYRRG